MNSVYINFAEVLYLDKIIYLDNSSTTAPCETAVKRINEALCERWGNPSSLHILGMEAENAVFDARKKIAKLLSCREDELYFTSGGTESNNTAIFGAAKAGKKRGNRIVTTSVEHPSVLEAMKRLEAEGFEVVYIKPQQNGSVSPADIEAAVDKNTVLVSIMLVNNETGAIQPVDKCREIIKKKSAPALLHCDAVQAFGKMPVNVSALGIDMLSISGHKIHGPKGIGTLYIKKGVAVQPFIVGGGQERGFRSGTESVPLIMGLGGAVEALPDIKSQLDKMSELKAYTTEKLLSTGLITVNSPENGLPYILNVSLNGYRSETLLHFLESKNIFVSSGSASAKGKGSYVLREMGLSADLADSALRISFSRYNTKADADALAQEIKAAAETLVRKGRTVR